MLKRFLIVGVCTLIVAFLFAASSGKGHAEVIGEVDTTLHREYLSAGSKPTFDYCNRLGWTRGVHNERGSPEGGAEELNVWIEECMAGRVPFHDASEEYRSRRTRK